MSETTTARWHLRYRVLALLAALAAVLGLTLTHGLTPAYALVTQSGPFPVGNMLNYDNSDFENGVGNWAPDASQTNNIGTFTTDSTVSLEHSHSLEVVATSTASAATMIYRLSNGSTNAVQISLPKTGGEYRVGAYFKGPSGVNQHYIEFDLGCYDSQGTFIAWVPGSQVPLNTSGKWQYIEDDITVPSNCARVQRSPRVQATNFNANGILHMDYAIFAPYRAGLAIGAHGEDCVKSDGTTPCVYTAQEWHSSWQALGSVGQTDKEFNADLPTTGTNPFSNTNCSGDESQVGSTSYSKWPVCIITYDNPVGSQTAMDNFLKSVPPQQEIYLVWAQEPEGKTLNTPDCPGDTGYKAFVCETEQQATYVHMSPYDKPNIHIVQNSAGSKYENGNTDEVNCLWITPASNTGAGVDGYLVDYYNKGTVPNNENVNQVPHNNEWQNWLNCVSQQNRPLGFGEYGLDNSPNHPASPYGADSLCTQSSSNAINLPTDLLADNTYLAQLPMSGQSQLNNNPAPFMVWDYWYSDYGGTADCTVFDNADNAIHDWENIENQNGGPVGG
jgi:hypothetical protein